LTGENHDADLLGVAPAKLMDERRSGTLH